MKRLLVGLCAMLACGAAASSPQAEFAPIDARLKACLARNGTTPGVDICNVQARASADRILNRLYRGRLDALKQAAPADAKDSAEIAKRLLASERAWIVYRDADCSLQSTSMLGGTGETNAYSRCEYELTKRRALDLEDIETRG